MSSLRRTGAMLAALGLAIGISIAAVPEARAAVIKQAVNLFTWRSVRVKSDAEMRTNVQPDGTTVKEAATTTWDRGPDVTQKGGKVEQKSFTSLADARAYLGNGALLPPKLEGQEMLAYRRTDKDGRLLEAGLAAPNIDFWARYYADGKIDKVLTTYSADLTVKTESITILGRLAQLTTAMQASGKGTVELWIEDGLWVYELHGYTRDLEQILALANSMK